VVDLVQGFANTLTRQLFDPNKFTRKFNVSALMPRLACVPACADLHRCAGGCGLVSDCRRVVQ
jgi:hypothetical protein